MPAARLKPIVAKIAGDMQDSEQADVEARLEGLGYEVIGDRADKFRVFFEEDFARVAEMVKGAGITPE